MNRTLREILERRSRRLETVPDAFVNFSIQFQKDTLADVVSLLSSLDRDGGNIALTERNLVLIEEIGNGIAELFNGDDYLDAVAAFAGEFDLQKQINASYFDELIEGYQEPIIAGQLVERGKTNAIRLLVDEAIVDNIANPIRSQIASAVSSKASYTDTLNVIRTLWTGDDNLDGLLQRYSRQIVSDAFAMTDASYGKVVSDELGLDWFLYTGGLIKTTRCFCKQRNGKFYHRKEIEQWGMGKGIGACASGELWAGAMKGTNAETIFIMRGGYNCQHNFGAVSEAVVPKEDIERAKNLGFL